MKRYEVRFYCERYDNPYEVYWFENFVEAKKFFDSIERSYMCYLRDGIYSWVSFFEVDDDGGVYEVIDEKRFIPEESDYVRLRYEVRFYRDIDGDPCDVHMFDDFDKAKLFFDNVVDTDIYYITLVELETVDDDEVLDEKVLEGRGGGREWLS